MIKVLFVEDDETALEPVRSELDMRETMEVQLSLVGFDNVEFKIIDFQPDVIVLDIFAGSPDGGEAAGRDKLERIWEQHFRPIIVYSAAPSAVEDEKYCDHPFIKFIRKGSGSELDVVDDIHEFQSLLEALDEALDRARKRFDVEFAKALRDASPLASSGHERIEVVERMALRRIAALLDEAGATVESSIHPWEQYVFPPVTTNLRQGDVLRQKGRNPVPKCYRVVLTPSCDLVESDTRSPKVEHVLVAQCVDIHSALERIGIQGQSSKVKARLSTLLSTGFERQIIPFPSLSDKIPLMAADVKNLNLLSFEDIRKDYDVVASVDSPFREVIAWAYVQIAARPGLPDRDTELWVEEIVDASGPKSGD